MNDTIQDLIDIIETIKATAMEDDKADFLDPNRFYIDIDNAVDLIYAIVDFSRELQKSLMILRRFASYTSLKSEVYSELFYLRAYLHKFLLALLFDAVKNKPYFYGLRRYGKLSFKFFKHKMLKELDITKEYLEDYLFFKKILTPPDIDPERIYIIWKDAKGSSATYDDIKLVYADSPEGTLLIDAFMISKFPAIVYPAGGVVIQGVRKINYAINTVRSSTKMDKYIDSDLFKESKAQLEEIVKESLNQTQKSFSGDIDSNEFFGLFRRTKRVMPIIKKLLTVEVGGFAKANTDLFTPVAAACYFASDKISTQIMMSAMITEKDIQDLYILALMLNETLGILDFVEQYRPPDINPPYMHIVLVGHSKCPACAQLKKSMSMLGLEGVIDDVRIDYVDALANPEYAAQFYQYVVDLDNPLQTMDSPLVYYSLVASSPPLNAELMLMQLDEELYDKLKRKIKQAKAIEIVGRGRRKADAGTAGTDVWQYGSRKIKLNYAVKFLRDAGFAWHQVSTAIAFFFGKQYSDAVLRKIYKSEAGDEEKETKKTKK